MTRQREKPLGLDMPFDEALERFIGVAASELPDKALLRKKRGPPKRPPSVDKKAGPKPEPNEPD